MASSCEVSPQALDRTTEAIVLTWVRLRADKANDRLRTLSST
jgi:hypothetical protein